MVRTPRTGTARPAAAAHPADPAPAADPAAVADPASPAQPEPAPAPSPETVALADEPFDPRLYLTRIGAADYLEVKWRLLWLRTEHPDAQIATDLHSDEQIPQGTKTVRRAIFHATIAIPGGGASSGWGSETENDFRDYLEKAETKALGRALAALGYGTQFGTEFGGEAAADRPVDTPVTHPAARSTAPARNGNGHRPTAAASSSSDQAVAATRRILKMDAEMLEQEADWDQRIVRAGTDIDLWRNLVILARKAVQAGDAATQSWRFAHLAEKAPAASGADRGVVLRGIGQFAKDVGALTPYVQSFIDERQAELDDDEDADPDGVYDG